MRMLRSLRLGYRRREVDRRHSPGISPLDLLHEALTGVTRRRGRSILTAIGTVLGVGAFVSTLGLTTTADAQIGKRFDILKATEVRLQDADPDRLRDPPFPTDAEERLEKLNGVVAAGLLWTVRESGVAVRYSAVEDPRGRDEISASLIGASPRVFEALNPVLDQGRLFDEFHAEQRQPVALLGMATARRLGISRVDRQPTIYVDGTPLVVIGVIRDVHTHAELLLSVIVPSQTASELWGRQDAGPLTIVIRTKAGAAQLIARQAPIALRPNDPERLMALAPPDPESLRGAVESDVDTLFLLLASVSLVVGTVGIANITLVSVLERVSEIGLRRALGAKRRSIALQFLLESSLLGSGGGLIGTNLAILIVVGVSTARQWTPVLEPSIVLPAPLIGTITGLVAGLYPALKASRIEPIEALRR